MSLLAFPPPNKERGKQVVEEILLKLNIKEIVNVISIRIHRYLVPLLFAGATQLVVEVVKLLLGDHRGRRRMVKDIK